MSQYIGLVTVVAASPQFETHVGDASLHLTTSENTLLDNITVSSTEINYLSGVTSDIQTQINNKLNSSTYIASDILSKLITVAGSGSGLDADKLDNMEGSFFRDASNLNAGKVPIARIGTTGTANNTTYFRGDDSWVTLDKTSVGLDNVENIALSTWGGSTNITTIGNVTASSLVVTGDLTVNGTTVTINATTITVDDKLLELGSVAVPSDTTADGGGILLKGTTDKSITWSRDNLNWMSTENINLSSGKAYKIGLATVISSTSLGNSVVNSSLTSVGTLISLTTSGQITSTLASGTSPFNVTSTTVCTNLNVDLLDGQHGSYYQQALADINILELTSNQTGDRYSGIDFHGDDTNTDFGLRILRGNTGVDAQSSIQHKGTGLFTISCKDAGTLEFVTNNTSRGTLSSTGVLSLITNIPSTSYTTGTLVVTGGAGFSSNIFSNGTVNAADGLQSTSINGLRIVYDNYGVFFRNDGSNFYLLQTASGDQYGTFNTYRPFYWDLATGAVTISGSGASVTISGRISAINGMASTSTSTGTLVVSGGIGVSGAIYTGSKISTANQLESTIATGTAPLAITSTTVCANLNADMLDGYHASSFNVTTWAIKTTNYTAVTNDALFVDTTSGVVTITLPATPSIGNVVYIVDVASKFATNKCTVARNGEKIMGLSENMDIQTNNAAVQLRYSNTTYGWRIL